LAVTDISKMKQHRVPDDKYNLMGLYHNQGSATYKLFQIMRRSIFQEKRVQIPHSEIVAAQAETQLVKTSIDASTPEFAQDLNFRYFGGENYEDEDIEKVPVRALLLARGDFVAKRGNLEKTVLPIDLGTNPWGLYKGPGGYDSVDTRVTYEQVAEFLDRHRRLLGQEHGFTSFEVTESSFYYFRDEDLLRNFGNGSGIDFEALVPFIADTYGYVGVNPVKRPNKRGYDRRIIPFTSYRQKQSLEEKAERELCEKGPYKNAGDVISDWGAHRICDVSEQGARSWLGSFQGNFTVGRFRGRVLHTDDYYARPKGTGFSSLNIAVSVASNKYDETVREIQIYDTGMHFRAQIDPEDPAFHRTVRERQRRSNRRRREIMKQFEYDAVLRLLLPIDSLPIGIPQ